MARATGNPPGAGGAGAWCGGGLPISSMRPSTTSSRTAITMVTAAVGWPQKTKLLDDGGQVSVGAGQRQGRPQVAVRPREVRLLCRQAPEDPPFHPLTDSEGLHLVQDLPGLRPLPPQDVQPGLEQPRGGAGRQPRDQRARFGWLQGERDAELLERELCPDPVIGRGEGQARVGQRRQRARPVPLSGG